MAEKTTNPAPVTPPPPATPAVNQPVYAPAAPVPVQPVYQQAVPPQPVYVTAPPAQVVYQQAPPAVPPPAPPPQAMAEGGTPPAAVSNDHLDMILVGHSSLFYWWPVWAVGYVMALLTLLAGETTQIGSNEARFFPRNYMGVVFLITLFMVILISNITLRGLASALTITGMALAVVVIAYFGWWDNILNWLGGLNVFLNEGAYFWFSTLMFLVWAFTTFVFDRLTYWRVTPGQITEKHVFGASTKSFDTENMTFEKRRDDIFRHWLLGMGSGDLIINAFSAGHKETIRIPNVLFIGRKIHAIQHMIATEPADISAGAAEPTRTH